MTMQDDQDGLIGVMSFGTDYAAAEKYADEWAGDTQEHAAVVEDFNLGGLMLVMDHAKAEEYIEGHNAEIQYDADHSTKVVTLTIRVRVDHHVPDGDVAQQIGDAIDPDAWNWDVSYPEVVQ